VPLIVSGPGFDPGRTDAFANTTDLTVTIAGLTGAEFSSSDSYGFGPVLAGADRSRDYVYRDHFTERQTKGGEIYGWALRETDFRLVVPCDAPR